MNLLLGRWIAGRFTGFVLLALVSVYGLSALAGQEQSAEQEQAGQSEKSPAEPADLRAKLIGAWELTGTPDGETADPAAGKQVKFFGHKHWTVTRFDPSTHNVIVHLGGTYTVNGNRYTETVEYGTADAAPVIGRQFKFRIEVDRDTYTQHGQDNPYSEAYKRAK